MAGREAHAAGNSPDHDDGAAPSRVAAPSSSLKRALYSQATPSPSRSSFGRYPG